MKSVLHRAESRGGAKHEWLNTHHTFSFANYYDPQRMGFGVLRVLNDDTIAPGKGFGMHPHDNMEIITIPLEGRLEHKDSMGNVGVVRNNDEEMDVQVMSAGTGIVHSEYNASIEDPVKLLQIWIMPRTSYVRPRYEQVSLVHASRHNKLQEIISPEDHDAPLWIHQNAWMYLGKFDKDKTTHHRIKSPKNGLYIFVISGSVQVGEFTLRDRDGLGIFDIDDDTEFSFSAVTDCEFLLFDVPMK
jgi:redox-sensitive bicupin YhaK (pirin superfamily)